MRNTNPCEQDKARFFVSNVATRTWSGFRASLRRVITSIVAILIICTTAHAEMKASWYSEAALKRDGQWGITKGVTASGQLFSDNLLTAASWDWPLGTKVKVTRTDKKAFVVVVVNDRTARRFKGKRIDLSKAAFMQLASLERGLVPVTIERINP